MKSQLIIKAVKRPRAHSGCCQLDRLNVGRPAQVKKVTLRLIETFVDKCEDTAMIATQFVPAMMDPVLGDYARNVPDARCACLVVCACLRTCEPM